MHTSLTIITAFTAAMAAAPISAQEADITIDPTVTAGDRCVQAKVEELATSAIAQGDDFVIGGDVFELIKQDCIASHGELNFEQNQTRKIVTALKEMSEADLCVRNAISDLINDVISGNKNDESEFKVTEFAFDGLASLHSQCEDTTGTDLDFYKDHPGGTIYKGGIKFTIK